MNEEQKTPESSTRQLLNNIWRDFSGFWKGLTDLNTGLDREGTVFSIRQNRNMEGANAWMLMCSIMIASLGLDLNSPAVIIGAMLISPLMAPILGVGLAVATNDTETLIQSLKHFSVAIGIAVVTSTLYFLLTPLGTATDEIMSRTAPTLLDVLIAIFGGIAGIISTSRKDQSSAIPGVAIATALMPPLCVTGFGLATGNAAVALKSFYLFFLNSFFVALATYFIVRLLRFPSVRLLDERGENRRNWLMTIVTLIILIPSTYILSGVIRDTRTTQRVDNFMRSHFRDYLNYIDTWQYVRTDSIDHLIVKVYGSYANDPPFLNYRDSLSKYKLKDITLDVISTSEFNLRKINELETELGDFKLIADELTQARVENIERDKTIDSLVLKLQRELSDTLAFAQIANELEILYPDISACGFAEMQYKRDTIYEAARPVLWIDWKEGKSRSSKVKSEDQIRRFLLQRTSLDTIYILSQ